MEFTAVILCGEGRNLVPFTAVRPSGVAKALLPVANSPMVSYAIDWCEKAQFKETIVVATGHGAAAVREYVEDVYKDVDVLVEEQARSSGELIASLADKITNDFVIVPCDFVTDVDPQTLVASYRRRDGDVLMSGVYYRNNLDSLDRKALRADLLVHTPARDRGATLLDAYDKDRVSDRKALDLRTKMLWQHAHAVVSANTLRSSLFFCSRKVLDLVNLPADKGGVAVKGKPWDKVVRDLARRGWQHTQPRERVTMMMLADDAVFVRANNLQAFQEANRYVMRLAARNAPPKHAAKGATASTATVGSDSRTGDGTTLGDKTSIKRTVVGSGCQIGKKCRLTGCVVLDGVTIGDDVTLENCIIGRGCGIGARTRLTSCNVEGEYQVPQGTQAKNETLEKLSMADLQNEYGEAYEESETESESDGGSSHWSESEGEDVASDDDGLFDRS